MPIITMPDINGAFSLTVTARFDTVIGGTGQTVFDFGDGTRQDDPGPGRRDLPPAQGHAADVRRRAGAAGKRRRP